MNKFTRIINTLIITAGCALFLLACDFFDFRDLKKSEDGKGTFSLEIGSGGASRTILPNSADATSAFTDYILVFTPASGDPVTVPRTASTIGNPFTLNVGTWSLTVTAKAGSEEVAKGTLTGIVINAGNNTGKSLNLEPITTGGTGTFTWNLTYPTEVTAATMDIIPLGTGSTVTESVFGSAKDGTKSALASGYYKVVFTFEHPTNDIVWVEYLHIYKGLTSTYTKTFPSYYFTGGTPSFVPVTNITGVPTAGAVGIALDLNPTVVPDNADNQTIVWSITDAGGTGISSIPSNNKVTATAAGTLQIKATITDGTAVGTDYEKNFTITFIVPVTDITGVPTAGAVGIALDLNPTVEPGSATNQTIVWTIDTDGGTSSSISGNLLTATAAGTVKVQATITDGTAVGTDYTKTFSIDIKAYGITLSPNNVPNDPYIITTTQTVTVSNAAGNGATGALTIALSGANSGSFDLSASSLTSIAAGANATFTVSPKAGLAAGAYEATVTVSGSNGISATLNVRYATGAITITFVITDASPSIGPIPTLSKSGNASSDPPGLVTLNASGFETISWSVDNVVKGTAATFNLDANDSYNTVGQHTLTVAGTLTGGAIYGTTVIFTVE